MKVYLLGLGNMGVSVALNMQDHGHEVSCWNRSAEKRESAKNQGLHVVEKLSDWSADPAPRVFWCMVSAEAVDEVIFGPEGLITILQPGDIVIEAGNSHFEKSQARAAQLAQKGVHMLDCGVSGGVQGARNGACMMVGGDEKAFETVHELLTSISVPEGVGYFGKSGAGHFVKMVHNGVEYGMMQSISEGMDLLNSSPFGVNLKQVAEVWNHGSIVESTLIGHLASALEEDPQLANTQPQIGNLGTGAWATETAIKWGVPFASIALALSARYQSQSKGFAYKITQAMRGKFGAHSSSDQPGK